MQFQEYQNIPAEFSGVLREQSPTELDGAENVAPPVLAWEIDVSDLTSSKTAKKRGAKRSSKLASQKSSSKGKKVPPYDPPAVSTTTELLRQRKCLDQSRWFCISRPQYSKSCGLSSLVSCWNYLFSSLGGGTMAPITQEQALTVLGFKPPFGEIRFGPFTGNATLMRWFKQLNDHYGVRGRAYYQYKPHGRGRTVGRTSAEGLHLLKHGLQDPNMAFIYHCYNHYFCPIGFEDVPLKAVDAYRDPLTQDEVETWILIGDPSRRHPGIHCFKWEDISTDLNCQNPEYMNIRKRHLGVQRRRTKKTGGNLHCIMAFSRSAGFLTRPARAKGKKPSTVAVSRSETTLSQSGHSSDRVVTSRSTGELGSCSQKIHKVKGSVSNSQVEKRLSQKSPRMSSGLDKGQKDTGKKASKTKTGSQSKRPRKSKSLATGTKSAVKEENLQENIIADLEETGPDQAESSSCMSQESQAKDAGNLDEVTRFIRDVSTKFGLSLDGEGAQRADRLKEAMRRSERRATNGGSRQDTGNEWVLLGKTSNQSQSRSKLEMGNTPIHLSELRGMDADSLHQVRLDHPASGTMQENEVSQVAKHLLDQYLSSIIESKAVQQDTVAPPSF
ncbi:basic immunoglobulin-like variable motif-containing protein [Diadema antillarum]|uniref:basic immunoglobulin-like variable motif-containing protein n=1 Tax=Diadema antillarum TaxID=105358 RepID=UPI003A845EEF